MQINELIRIANETLKIDLPEQYVTLTLDGTFKTLYAYYDIYFLDSGMIDIYKIPCAIGATLIFREKQFIPRHDSIALANYNGTIFYFNTVSKHVVCPTKIDVLHLFGSSLQHFCEYLQEHQK